MDHAYHQYSDPSRRKNRSATNLTHLSLAPLTTKLPIADPESLPDLDDASSPPLHHVSYLQGKSAPTTPRLLSHHNHHQLTQSPSPLGRRSRRSSNAYTHSPHPSNHDHPIPKSKSAIQLDRQGGHRKRHSHHAHFSGTLSPSWRRPGQDDTADDDASWMHRAGALISTEARESKGQTWLISRASSTSLTGLRDASEEALQREIAREREVASRHHSRHASMTLTMPVDELLSPALRAVGGGHSRGPSKSSLRTPGRTPIERVTIAAPGEDYFNHQDSELPEEYSQGPNFVGLDEKLESVDDMGLADEATVRRLVKRESAGMSAWMHSLLGFSLFSVEEGDDEEAADDDEGDPDGDEDEDGTPLSRTPSCRQLDCLALASDVAGIPPPKDEGGGWQDAAWLLSVASKVVF